MEATKNYRFLVLATIAASGQDPAGSLDKQMTSATPGRT